jgi:anion-transporting  ArsA/GET3 family ATPase
MDDTKSTRSRRSDGPQVLLCMGPGGVGKTTCAAALALAEAARGRRVVVVTIDPSYRLAQALGISSDGDAAGTLKSVELPEGQGALDALLLDSSAVFDAVVRAGATSEAAASAMLENSIYQATSRYLGGALEYAAMARLQMLYEEARHDLIVLDTPPAANALEFLEAPSRVRGLVDNPAAKVVLGGGRVGGRLLGLGASTLMRVLGRMGGGEFVRDLALFLTEFSGMIEDFHRRGVRFERALRSASASALVVTSSANFSVQETIDFTDALQGFGIRVRATLVNRVTPDPGSLRDRAALEASLSTRDLAREKTRDDLDWVYQTHAQSVEAHRRSVDAIARLDARFPTLQNLRVERQDPAPEDLDALLLLGQRLWSQLYSTSDTG